MLSARELKKSGLDVLLLEKGQLGKESSWAGGGILSPLHPWRYSDEVNQLAAVGHKIYPDLAEELYRESGVDPEYDRSGMMVLNSAEQQQASAWAEKWSIRLSVISSKSVLHDQVPGLGEQYDSGLWMPDIGQMRNPRIVKAARGSLQSLGVSYKENTQVESLSVVNGQIKGVVANGKQYHADRVLIAGGAWSAEILRNYRDTPDIEPVKGQMILFKGKPGLLKHMLLDESRYLIPRKDGRILCGSTIEHSGFDKSIDSAVKQELLNSATSIYPALNALEIEHHWAGLRPGSPKGDPYIAEHSDIKGLFINAGHYRNGVILSAGSAQKIAGLICES